MRLNHKTIRPTGAAISIRFDGQVIPALAGETVAAALSAAGIVAFRRRPGGAPRGLHCGMGACFDCVVTIDGRIGQRACLTKVSEAMQVSSAMPETPAPLAARSTEPAAAERDCDVLVVGGGPAGLSAAIAAAEAGAAVVLLDERAATGGQYAKPLADSHEDAAPDKQFRLGRDLAARARKAGVTVENDAIAWAGFAPDEIGVLIRNRAVTFHPRRLVLAPGAHERPVPIPGWTLPGVMTTGALQTLVRAQRVSPGEHVVIAGNGPLNLQLACELLACGVKPAAVVEAAPFPGLAALHDAARMTWAAPDLAWEGIGMLARLRRAGVPVLWGTRALALEGEARVTSIRLSNGRTIAADTVALNLGFQPEVGLARALGVPHRFVDVGIGHLATEADDDGRTAVAGVFAVGDGARLGGARVALARGHLAGLAAARDLGLSAPEDPVARAALARAVAFQDALWRVFAPPAFDAAEVTDATIVCRCEEVTAGRLRQEIAGGLGSVAALKKATRAGMGRCQGRFCAATVARLAPGLLGGGAVDAGPVDARPVDANRVDARPVDAKLVDDWAFAAPRAPVRPVPAAPLMFPAEEFEAPLLTAPEGPAHLHPLPTLPLETRRADIVVLGGGLAGMCTAYWLAKEGADVLVVDRDEAGMAASTANAGSLHAQLLSYDFDDDTPEDGGSAAYTLPLAPRSIALWKEIAAEAGESLGIRTEGGLMLAANEAELAWLRRKSAMERRWGTESHVLGANELRDLAPALSERLVGADFVPAEGYGDPLRGTLAVRRLALQHGARLLTGAEATSVARDGAGWRVGTTRGELVAGRVVNATGPWSARIGRMVGLDLPVTGTVQQVIVTEPAPPMTKHLIALANRHLSLKQQASGGFLIGGGWFGSFDPGTGRTQALRRSIEGNLSVCTQVLPVLHGLSFIRCWTGINSAIDRAPILGEAPGLPGFFNAVAANGFTLGPVIGRITADAVLGRETVDPHYRLERFG
jgi:glycine/D-amino acid oxidase-like deaminating enzyme